MYGIYGNIYHQYTPNASIYTIHGWILWIMVVKTSQITNGTQMETEMVGTGEVSLKNSRSHRLGIPHTHQLLTHLISWPGTIVRKRLGRRGSERNSDFFFQWLDNQTSENQYFSNIENIVFQISENQSRLSRVILNNMISRYTVIRLHSAQHSTTSVQKIFSVPRCLFASGTCPKPHISAARWSHFSLYNIMSTPNFANPLCCLIGGVPF